MQQSSSSVTLSLTQAPAPQPPQASEQPIAVQSHIAAAQVEAQEKVGEEGEEELVEYPWFDSVPEGLKTKTQLRQIRLVPTDEPKGYVYWRRKHETYYLYDQTETRPIREASPKQKVALEKARRKRYTCPECDTYYGSRYELTGWGGRYLPRLRTQAGTAVGHRVGAETSSHAPRVLYP
jgi:hypothetical protein